MCGHWQTCLILVILAMAILVLILFLVRWQTHSSSFQTCVEWEKIKVELLRQCHLSAKSRTVFYTSTGMRFLSLFILRSWFLFAHHQWVPPCHPCGTNYTKILPPGFKYYPLDMWTSCGIPGTYFDLLYYRYTGRQCESLWNFIFSLIFYD